jgi:transposase
MRAGIVNEVTSADRIRVERIAGDRNTPQKHSARARVILATAEGCGTLEIVRRSGLSKPVVWRWQERFMHEGVAGLLRDKTRPPGKPALPVETVKRVVDLTLAALPGEATHWTERPLVEAVGVSLRSVQRIWAAHGLAPHRVWTSKLSTDPRFLEKFTDVVGLFVDPPAHAVVLSLDEKSQHPRFIFHFTPTSCSWLNAVENFFVTLTKRRLKRGVFRSIVELQAAINRYLAEHNRKPRPFVWKASPKRVLAAIERGKQALQSIH